MAAAQYGGKAAGDLLYLTYLRTVSPNVAMASQLLVKTSDMRSRLRVGAHVKMPRTKSELKFSYTTGGYVTSCWERRLLSTVKLQVVGELDLYAFQAKPGQRPPRGNRFGVMLQIG